MSRATVAVGMSGGTDSSMAAHLLVEQGADVRGLTFRLWHEPGNECSMAHIERAQAVAARLGIPHTVIDIARPFLDQIVRPFVASYVAGITPSPCVRCNQLIKFGILLEQANCLGCDMLATGHYAKTGPHPLGGGTLLQGDDPTKDQSYFLAGLTRQQLGRAIFPLGMLTKAEVKATAATLGLTPPTLGESQDLCFVPDGDCAAFVERITDADLAGGDIVDMEGHVLGKHHGVHRYTVGQRRGLGLGGGPWYVVALDAAQRHVVVAPREALFARVVALHAMNWIGECPKPGVVVRVVAQLRYNMEPAAAAIEVLADGSGQLTFDEPVYAVTPGQFAVYYQGNAVLGGAWIRGVSQAPIPSGGRLT